AFRSACDKYCVWVILIKGLTPIPYKLVTIATGAVQFDLTQFILASIATRGARFFIEAALLLRYGEPIRDFIERRLTLVTTPFLLPILSGLLFGGYVAWPPRRPARDTIGHNSHAPADLA